MVLFGIETHVCVQQTALDLIDRGIDVHIVAEVATIRGLEADLARQEFLKRILKSATFIVAITVAGC